MGWGKSVNLGRGMYALGYPILLVVARCVITFPRNPVASLGMFLGFISTDDPFMRLDVADWVGRNQKSMFWFRVKKVLRRGGRK